MQKLIFVFLALFSLSTIAFAQCSAGQTEVAVTIVPDNAGSETTWILKNSFSQVPYGNAGPYPNGNTTPVTTNVCVNDGTNVTFKISDSNGNGMCCLQGNGYYFIMIGTDTIWKNGTFGFSDSVSFLVPPVSMDLSAISINTPDYIDQSSSVIAGKIANKGTSTITSMRINYSINNDSAVTENRSGLNIQKYKTYNYSFTGTLPWTPGAEGYYTIKVWATFINGNSDMNTANDVFTKTVYAADHLAPKRVLLEAFTSCTDTLGIFSESILDSLIADNPSKVAAIKYHVGFPPPGNDPMYYQDSANSNFRKNLYSIPTNVPRVVMDGNIFSGPAYGISQTAFDTRYAKKGIFDILLDETKTSNNVSIDVKTISLVPLTGANVKVFVAVIEEPVQFTTPPCLGNKTIFTNVSRKILPGVAGSLIGSPVAGQENNFAYNFTIDPGMFVSDNLKTIVFIQDMNTKEILQVLEGDTSTGNNHLTTIDAVAKINSAVLFVRIFPNPVTENTIYVSYFQRESEKVVVKIYDLLGRQLFYKDYALSSGSQFLKIDSDLLPSGIFILNVSSPSFSLSEKLIKINTD